MADEDADNSYREAYNRKLEELQKRQEQEQQMKSALKQILEPAAFSRLQNIRLSNQELYFKVAQLLVYLYQQGKIKNKVDEEMLKALLSKLIGGRRESKISFNRK